MAEETRSEENQQSTPAQPAVGVESAQQNSPESQAPRPEWLGLEHYFGALVTVQLKTALWSVDSGSAILVGKDENGRKVFVGESIPDKDEKGESHFTDLIYNCTMQPAICGRRIQITCQRKSGAVVAHIVDADQVLCVMMVHPSREQVQGAASPLIVPGR